MIRSMVILLACLYPVTGEAAVKFVSFSELRKGDTLWVAYSSSGCFHNYRAELVLYGRDPNVAFVKVWNRYLFKRDERDVPEARSVALTPEDRLGLDSLINYCRVQTPEISTSVSWITFTSSRKGRRSDPIRVRGQNDRPRGVLTLDELTWSRPALASKNPETSR